MIEGTSFKLGENTTYVVPPLNIRLFKKHKELISELTSPEKIKGMSNEEYIEKSLPLLLDNLKRNYPTLTPEQLEEDVSIGDMPLLVAALWKASGLKEGRGEGTPGPKALPDSKTSTGTG